MTAKIKMNIRMRSNVILRMVAMTAARAARLLPMADATAMAVIVHMATTEMM